VQLNISGLCNCKRNRKKDYRSLAVENIPLRKQKAERKQASDKQQLVKVCRPKVKYISLQNCVKSGIDFFLPNCQLPEWHGKQTINYESSEGENERLEVERRRKKIPLDIYVAYYVHTSRREDP